MVPPPRSPDLHQDQYPSPDMDHNSQVCHRQAPKCIRCIYGEMTKCPWRTKGKQGTNRVHPVTAPGQYVSVNQMESMFLGFTAQLKGRLTKNRYRAATLFVEHYTWPSYMQLQGSCRSLASEEILSANNVFETFVRKQGVVIRCYHENNILLAYNSFIQSLN